MSTKDVIKRTLSHKLLILVVLAITFLVSCLIILPIPRYYICDVELAPEVSTNKESKISSVASSFGIDLGEGATEDAISPTIYPELIQSNNFIVNLIHIPVADIKGKKYTSYYDYIGYHQKSSLYAKVLGAIKKIFAPKEKPKIDQRKINITHLTKKQFEVFKSIQSKLSCSIDIKTELISISVKDQDPVIAATMADSVRVKLQEFITKYRTNKARVDVQYYQKLTQEAKSDYEKSRENYGQYADANSDVILETVKSKEEEMENDMQLKFNAYSALSTQLQNAKAKVQENTPAFTIVKGASVPVKPAGPKRMAFVAAMLFLSFILTITYINKDLLGL